MTAPAPPQISTADRVYDEVRAMATNFAFKPDERVNEGRLAERVTASRTPLREALNRLAAEGFFRFEAGQGFFCRSLGTDQILDLYEARRAIETETARLAAGRAVPEQLAKLRGFFATTAQRYHDADPAADLVALDEEFHMRIAALASNAELMRMLTNLNDRLRFIRLIDMETRRGGTPTDHLQILEALEARDADLAAKAMNGHITRRREDAAEAARTAFARLYVS